MKNSGNWIKYGPELKKELDNGFYDIKLDNGTIKLATFHRDDGKFHSNAINGEVYAKTEEHIKEIRKSFMEN